MKLSAVRKSQPVELEFDNQVVVNISVKEMTGAQRDEYYDKIQKRSKFDEEGNLVGVKDYKGLFSTLLALTVYDAEGKLIPEAKIQDWPDSVQQALFEVARDLNGLNKEGNEKN